MQPIVATAEAARVTAGTGVPAAARMRLDPRPVDLMDAVRQVVERLRPTLKAHPVEIRAEQPSPVVHADPGRLDQILTNLIDNAAKFSPADAPITLHVTARDEHLRS